MTIPCPHCTVETTLLAPGGITPVFKELPSSPPSLVGKAQAATPPSSRKKPLVIAVAAIVTLAIGTVVMLKFFPKESQPAAVIEPVEGGKKAVGGKQARPSPAPLPAEKPDPSLKPGPGRVAGEDLELLRYGMQKASEGSLQYVVGSVTNHSDKQLFNVRIEFAVTRAEGKPGGPATDQQGSLAARAIWNFRANILGMDPASEVTLQKLTGEKE